MGTQKTGINKTTNEADEDRTEIGGRSVRKVDMRNTLHQAMAAYAPGENMMSPPPPEASAASKEEVDRAIPEFLRQQEVGPESKQKNAPLVDGLSPDKAEMANKLAQKIVEAKSDGREEAAKELQDLLGSLMGEMEPKRIRVKKEAHPALQKLRRNLGIQRIQPRIIPWCGIKWHLYPAPPTLDMWAAQMVQEGLGSYSALKLSAMIVGLDGTPLYKIFGVETKASFEPPDGSKPIDVRLYEKRCDSCSEIIDVESAECTCGSLHDPFTMPLNLRVRCAELMNRFFTEEFGPYEDLHLLLATVREQMPDRIVNKDELYPFPELSLTSLSKTDTTPTGEKPSSD